MERKEQTGHICRWMALGIMTAIVIVGCTIVIGLFEWRDRKEIECRNAELHQWRKNVHDLNLHITELSLLGEMVADWDSTDVNEYHSLRLEVDSMLEGIAGICPKEDSDTICRLLAEKEQLLLDIKDAMQELNATQEKLTAEVPRIVEQNKTESKRLSAMPQQAKPKKRGFFSRLFGKKENAVTTGNRLTQTEKMLTNLNQTVVAKHHQQSRKVVEILDSLGNRNEGINKQLQRVISIADENVDKGIKVRERQIADLEGNYTYYYIGMIGLLILVFFVLFLLVWRFAFKTRKSKEETRKVMLTVTHEMRSPLSAIKDYARKISGLEDATDESKRYADLIVDTSKGLTSMIDSFLVYSKLANGKATVKERPFRMMDIAEQLKMEYEPFAIYKNNSESSLKVVWDEAAFVNENNESGRIIHKGVAKGNANESQTPTVVLKGTELSDLIAPVDRLDNWLIPHIGVQDPKMNGKTVKILLPIEIKGVVNEYIFTFDIVWRYAYPKLQK